MFSQPIKKDYVRHQLDKLSPAKLAEVSRFIEFLQFDSPFSIQENVPKEELAFGMWQDYPEAKDLIGFAFNLRRQIETRQDVTANTFN